MNPERTGSPMSRRRFLKLSAVAGAALAGGSALLMGGSTEHYRKLLPPGARPHVLSEKELAVLAAVTDRLFPAEPGWLSTRDARLAERIDKELSFQSPRMQSDFKAALLLVEHGGLLHGGFTRFTRLSPAEQDARLERMAEGPELERQVVGALRVMGNFFYYADERTWDAIHYEGPHVEIPAPPLADSRIAPRKEG
ncbi:MAG TPA: gluconate 2-dehydrogenase subunit 3 family protein [Myxococcaceae bacterium]|nr:gluconate 2-dehydrogenase subunit 3 family protein [Myxococcaceae bacterium]